MLKETPTAPAWSLRPCEGDSAPDGGLPKRSLLLAVAKRGLPGIIEASFIPAAIFLLSASFFDARAAMIAVLLFGIATVTWRKLRRRPLPSLVVLALAGLGIRTLVGLVSGSTFAYFLQPIATTVAIGVVFFVSAVARRPVVARIAHDFCPIAPDVSKRPAVVRLFAGLTVLWAAAQFLTAGATLGMLLSLDTNLFVVLKPVLSLTISAAAITITILWALRTAHREELVFATVA
jgi:hypothetical protein